MRRALKRLCCVFVFCFLLFTTIEDYKLPHCTTGNEAAHTSFHAEVRERLSDGITKVARDRGVHGFDFGRHDGFL